MVVMSMETYEEQLRRHEFYQKLDITKCDNMFARSFASYRLKNASYRRGY
jgi:hypothetical protein